MGSGPGVGSRAAAEWRAPHVVVLSEEGVILHRPLLQLHVQAAPVDRHNLADAAGPQGGALSGKGRLPCPSPPGCSKEGRGPTDYRDTHDSWLKKKKLRTEEWRSGCGPGQKLRNWGAQ